MFNGNLHDKSNKTGYKPINWKYNIIQDKTRHCIL